MIPLPRMMRLDLAASGEQSEVAGSLQPIERRLVGMWVGKDRITQEDANLRMEIAHECVQHRAPVFGGDLLGPARGRRNSRGSDPLPRVLVIGTHHHAFGAQRVIVEAHADDVRA